ncbi:ras-related protein Ral-B isoform X3 [Hippopotamus amphibius kiboko]|uniref:ras-related protein Ral-B isoform X3 n=1 Tax=Hippopotamus amphibius kiboko TaxID=575201 RepID=UPI00259880FD|nr:ras-related protein Ral-B isoform X3 [Hippopotamus amphibius kiboko]
MSLVKVARTQALASSGPKPTAGPAPPATPRVPRAARIRSLQQRSRAARPPPKGGSEGEFWKRWDFHLASSLDGPQLVFHSSFGGHLGRFHILAVVKNAALNTGAQTSIQLFTWVLWPRSAENQQDGCKQEQEPELPGPAQGDHGRQRRGGQVGPDPAVHVRRVRGGL